MPHNHLQEVLHQISWYPSEWFLGFPLVTPPPKPKKKSGQKRLSLRICALRPGFKMLFASSKNKGRNIPSDIATETCPWGLTCTNHGVSTLAVNWTDCCQSLGYLPSTIGSSQINPNILLMEEIAHQLGCTTPYKKKGWTTNLNWCRISSINSRPLILYVFACLFLLDAFERIIIC